MRAAFRRHNRLLTFLALCCLALCLAAAFWLGRRSPTQETAKHGEAGRKELVTSVRNAIERAGGQQVWIKRSALWPPAATEPVEVVVTSRSYPAVLAVIQRVSEKENLKLRKLERHSAAGLRTADIGLDRGRTPVCQWRVREVPQLLRVAIVIDDLGQDLHHARELLALPYPLTFSVLPHLPYSTETAEVAHRSGREVMLHLPMQAEPGAHPSPGAGAILIGMKNGTLRRVLSADLRSVPYVAGVNNHMGSLATTSPTLMGEVMEALAERRLYFIDSRTTAESVALDVARHRGLPTFYRSVFLDDEETVPYTLARLRQFRNVVEEQGVALAIGHPHPSTIEALAKFLPEFEKADIEIVRASQLVRLPEAKLLHPSGPSPHK